MLTLLVWEPHFENHSSSKWENHSFHEYTIKFRVLENTQNPVQRDNAISPVWRG